MNILRCAKLGTLLCIGSALAPPALADDIDIFLGMSGGTGDAPNVMILIDNGPNWSRVSQGWPDPNNPGATITQGLAELNAIIQVLGSAAAQAQSRGNPSTWVSRCSRPTTPAPAAAAATSASARAT